MSIRQPEQNEIKQNKVVPRKSLFKTIIKQPQLPQQYRIQHIETSNFNHIQQKIIIKPSLQVKREPEYQKPIYSTKTPFKIEQMPLKQANQQKQKHRIFDKTSIRSNGQNIKNIFDPLQKVNKITQPYFINQYGLSEHDYKLIIQRPYKPKQQSKKDIDKKNSDGMSVQSKDIQQKNETVISNRSANRIIVNERQVKRNRIYNGFTLPTQKCYLQVELNEKEQIQTKIDDLEQLHSQHEQMPAFKYEEYVPKNNSKFQMKQSKRESNNSINNNMKINYNERKQRLFDDDD